MILLVQFWHQRFLTKLYFIFSVQQLWDFPTQISFQEYVLQGEQLKDNTQLPYFELQQDAHPLCPTHNHNLWTQKRGVCAPPYPLIYTHKCTSPQEVKSSLNAYPRHWKITTFLDLIFWDKRSVNTFQVLLFLFKDLKMVLLENT
jgi:hypothetical protein